MRLMIDIPSEIYDECKMQAEFIRQEGVLPESTNLALKILIADGKVLGEESESDDP